MKMFNMIGIGERTGSGVPDIFAVWDSQGWVAPKVEEEYNPDRTILTLSFIEKQAEKASRNGQMIKTVENKKQIVEFLKKEGAGKAAEIAEYIHLNSARVRVLLSELMDEGKVQTEGNGRSRRYTVPDDFKP